MNCKQRRITADQHTAETTVTRLSRIVCIFTAASYQTKGVAWNSGHSSLHFMTNDTFFTMICPQKWFFYFCPRDLDL